MPTNIINCRNKRLKLRRTLMRSAPKKSMPVVLKNTKDSPVMYITGIDEATNEVQTVWVDKIGAPYTGKFSTDVLAKYKEPSNKDD